jgi:hypothetical protein
MAFPKICFFSALLGIMSVLWGFFFFDLLQLENTFSTNIHKPTQELV